MKRTAAILAELRAHESRNVTFIEPDGSWPIVWERARGVHVRDAEGRRYLDLTAAFGVAAAGHANPRVVRAGQRQMATLLHAMGDVHPHALKARLARQLSRLTFERWNADSESGPVPGKVIFCNSGFEAVEAALKTALLATGRPEVIAFDGAYHGLGYGSLNATHRARFRSPFRRQLREFARFAPFPEAAPWAEFPTTPKPAPRPDARSADISVGALRRTRSVGKGDEGAKTRLAESSPASHPSLAEVERRLRALFRRRAIGAVLVEPMQARGGIRIPPAGFLPLLRRLCDAQGALLIADEIYTGFGRTGRWFACEHSGVTPDLICLGKALTGGFPLSACVGRADLMDAAWPPSDGEALHTSTFLGHPVGCAMALAQMAEIERRGLVALSMRQGEALLRQLADELASRPIKLRARLRGVGLMAGIELLRPDGAPATHETIAALKALLRRGFILLPEGEHANVLGLTPPLTISAPQLSRAAAAIAAMLADA